MANTRDIIYLAALLHDIGKFWQRADDGYQQSKGIALYPSVMGNIGNICPTTQDGYPKYQHVIWTQLFFETHENIFKKLGIYENPSSALDNLTNVSIHHHKPTSRIQAFIQLADWWASGIDRSQANDYHNEIKRGKLKFKEEPLINIFGNLNVVNSSMPKQATAFGLSALSLTDNILPSFEKYEAGVSQHHYQMLWEQFQQEFKQLPTDNREVFCETLYYLLKKYTWCIPASTIDFADNSLFHHLKTTAAIAQCLYDYNVEQPDAIKYERRLSLVKGHFPLLLVCVDLSGIQKFIYNISSKYAAKSLKGRSFSLQLMLDSIASELVRLTHTTLSHIVYSSGGKFYMLLPNTQNVRNTLSSYEQSLKKAIWDKYKGSLYICLGYEAFAYDLGKREILTQNGSDQLGDLWKNVSEKTSEKKFQKFRDLLLNDFNSFFEPLDHGGNFDICAISGNEIEQGKKRIDDDVTVSPQIYEQKKIGEALVNHHFIVQSHQYQANLSEEPNFISLDNGRFWILDELLQTENTNVCLSVKKEIDFIKPVSARLASYSFRFYGGSEVAMKSSNLPKTFEDLAQAPDKNYHRLAVLRMDVDNLGQLFIKGFNKDKASFSAYATLSGQLDWFFSGYINILRQREAYRDWVNIIYSGGDDLFAVGRWDAIILFADEVQREFKRFTGRSDITLSAGITIITPKFPLAKAAELAGEAEEAAKNHRFNGQAKNALYLFGITINWDDEFPNVVRWKNILVDWLEAGYISKGLLQQLFSYYEIYKFNLKAELEAKRLNIPFTPDSSWKWQCTYNLAKRLKNAKGEKRDALARIQLLLFTELHPNRFRFEVFATAMRWAELEIRDTKKSTKTYEEYA
ncbi:type III-A CRISPR-associated protein Cas10/Csm1 [Rhabdobacter roseus]|uniref:CRISPR system single-strand-specific deoxyribonuclease Cas10/Csm1 (subtype III-A) n=1 Tax=Rhabdobacter roseus TaxID=1655419 RepID=A0A840TU25_9BACT|nr:type III-A CRISPR-associated protein Cas10/Csm1 [Rhabdobacter roseus]MBB5287451.1 CRISPR-associated protein Csm1 [Rhabdobacter roseus]